MNCAFLKTCISTAKLYRTFMLEPTVSACPDLEADAWSSLKFFLLGYAFERQGRSPDYAPAAADTIDDLRGMSIDAEAAEAGWAIFSQKLGGRSLNHANNPMCPKGTCYSRKYETPYQLRTSNLSALELAAQVLEGKPIVAWAKELLADDTVAEAHRTLTLVNGVSHKIASFFLRDVATISGLKPSRDRYLLQPVDTWIRFVVQALAGDNQMDDRSCASFITEQTCDPESANQGIWYFCTMVAGSSKYLVIRCIDSPDHTRVVLDRHLATLARVGQAASGLNGRIEL